MPPSGREKPMLINIRGGLDSPTSGSADRCDLSPVGRKALDPCEQFIRRCRARDTVRWPDTPLMQIKSMSELGD